MIVEKLFNKPLMRDINGVVKAEQLDEQVIYTELDEYVVTKELDRHFRNFLETYVAAIRNPNDPSIAGKVGVWVSGFFGSGKSHFIKILSYLLENIEAVGGGGTQRAVQFFEEKVSDHMLLMDIKQAAKQSADVILFNIDSRANTGDKEDAILKVFIKVFNERLGYCADHAHIAHMERELDGRGQYETFKKVFKQESGSEWENERDAWDFCQDEIITARSAATGQSVESSRLAIENLENNFQLNIKNFAGWVNDYIHKQEDHKVIFLVDEVGQFIGKNTQLMLNLQTITEELGTLCKGKAWVIVTSQADIDAVLGGMKRAGDANGFSKIQGRFYTRISLSSSNTNEVIQKRLLEKTEPATEKLTTFYADKGDILRNQLSFDQATTAELKNYEDNSSFIDNYPFVPYHYPLLQKVFESIRTKGATGKHLAMGERSLLDAFQSAAKQIKDQEVGVLVPMHCFYTPIEGFLEPAVKRTIDNACDLATLSSFDTNILKTLFLVRYVDVLKSTLDNLVTLSVDQIDSDKIELKREIEQSLERLERAMLIARNGDEYFFLTNEEKEIEKEILHTEVESAAQIQHLSQIIFDELLKGKNKYRYPKNNQDFKVSRFCDGHARDGANLEDLVVKIVSPLDVNYAEYTDTRCKSVSSEANGSILIKLEDKKKLWDELSLYVKTSRFLKLNTGNRPEQENLIRDKALENSERETRLRHGFEELFQEATFYMIGDENQPMSSTSVAMMDESYQYVIENTFSKLNLLKLTTGDINLEIQAVLAADDIAQLGLDLDDEEVSPEAVREVESYITMKIGLNQPVYLRDLLNHFNRHPYGWPDSEVVLILARLALARKIEFTYQSADLPLKQAYARLTSIKNQKEIRIKQVQQVGAEQLDRAAKAAKHLFNKTIQANSEKELDRMLRGELQKWEESLREFENKSQSGKYPGKEVIDRGRPLVAGVVSQPNSFSLIQRLLEDIRSLEEFAEDFEDLNDFYNNQFTIWQALESALNQEFSINRDLLEEQSQDAKQALEELEQIYNDDAPYSRLNRVNNLIETVRNINNVLLEEKREAALGKVQQRVKQVQQQLEDAKAPDEVKNSALKPLQDTIHNLQETRSIYRLISGQSESSEQEDRAYEQLNQYIETQQEKQKKSGSGKTQPVKKTRTIYPATIHGSGETVVIETANEAEVYLDTLKNSLIEAINAGDRVRIQ